MYYTVGIRNRYHLAEFESDNALMHLKNEEHAEAAIAVHTGTSRVVMYLKQ